MATDWEKIPARVREHFVLEESDHVRAPGIFWVTDLVTCLRRAYYDIRHTQETGTRPGSDDLEKGFNIKRGIMFEDTFYSGYPERWRQVHVTHRLRSCPVTVMGRADVVDWDNYRVIEVKAPKSLYYFKSAPRQFHVYQVSLYAHYLTPQAQACEIHYWDSTGCVVHEIPLTSSHIEQVLNYFERRGLQLYTALRDGVPPEKESEFKWQCPGCEYHKECKADESGEDNGREEVRANQ